MYKQLKVRVFVRETSCDLSRSYFTPASGQCDLSASEMQSITCMQGTRRIIKYLCSQWSALGPYYICVNILFTFLCQITSAGSRWFLCVKRQCIFYHQTYLDYLKQNPVPNASTNVWWGVSLVPVYNKLVKQQMLIKRRALRPSCCPVVDYTARSRFRTKFIIQLHEE